MRRSTTHESRYGHPARERSAKSFKNCKSVKGHGRRGDAASEGSSRRDNSSLKYAEESDLAREKGVRNRKDAELNRQKNKKYTNQKYEYDDTENHPYYVDQRNYTVVKKNKKTQKNLISPTPSFLPPTERIGLISELSGKKFTKLAEKEKPLQTYADSSKTNSEDEDQLCFHHHQTHNLRESQGQKHGSGRPQSSNNYNEKLILTDDTSKEDTNKTTTFTDDGDSRSKNFTDASGSSRKLESYGKNGSDTRQEQVKRGNSKKGKTLQPCKSDREIAMRNSVVENSRHVNDNKKAVGPKTKEKLVYVVEEDGQSTTKMETDLFSVNEILTIKKDLLELSEFAKKLKKLKEMKNKTDNAKNNEKSCNCRSASDLLKDVNRRIEALEARQEELEKGNSQNPKALGPDSGSKKENLKIASDSFKKMSVGNQANAPTIANPVLSKPEVIASIAEGFSTSSDIVGELMDIKTQLQKLEKRKMAKEISVQSQPHPQTQPQPSSNLGVPKKKGHAIAVFSSKTYILTSSNNYRRKHDKKHSKSANNRSNDSAEVIDFRDSKSFKPDEKNWKSKTEKTRENVANWLKNVPTNSYDLSAEAGTHMAPEMRNRSKEKGSAQAGRCRNCNAEFTNEDFEIQVPNKNRASERVSTDKNEKERSKMNPIRQEMESQLECDECLLTESAKRFAFGQDLQEASISPMVSSMTAASHPENYVTSTLLNLLRRSVSSNSFPAPCATQEGQKKLSRVMKSKASNYREASNLESSRSKSLQELPSCLNVPKSEKTMNNMSTKMNATTRSSVAKESKESKNEIVKNSQNISRLTEEKKQEKTILPTTLSSRSFLVRETNLEKDSRLMSNDSNKVTEHVVNQAQLFSATARTASRFRTPETHSPIILKINNCCEGDRPKCKKKKDGKHHSPDCPMKHREAIYIYNVSKTDSDKSKKKKKKKKAEKYSKKKEKKRSKKKCVEQKVTPPQSDSNCVQEHGRKGKGNYHFKSKKMFRSTKKKCECCPSEEKQVCEETKEEVLQPEECEERMPKKESDYSYKEYIKRCKRRLEEAEREAARLAELAAAKEALKEIPKEIFEEPHCSHQVDASKSKEACGLTNFLRNIRSLYPRCSYLKFLPSIKISYDKVTSNNSKERRSFKDRLPKTYCKELYGCNSKPKRTCKCVQVLLQTQHRIPREGAEHCCSYEKSSDNVTKKLSSSSQSVSSSNNISYTRRLRPDDEIYFRYPKPKVYYATCEDNFMPRPQTRECSKKEMKRHKKVKKEERRRRKREEKEARKMRTRCCCSVCGNIHKKYKNQAKRKPFKKTEEVTCGSNLCKANVDPSCPKRPESNMSSDGQDQGSESPSQCSECAAPDQEEKDECSNSEASGTPLFSFIKNICSRKSKAGERSSIFAKINEVRKMKVCSSPKKSSRKKGGSQRSKKNCKKCGNRSSPNSYRVNRITIAPDEKNNKVSEKNGPCRCAPKLDNIEGRLTALEKMGGSGNLNRWAKPKSKTDYCKPANDECANEPCGQPCCFVPSKEELKRRKEEKKRRKKEEKDLKKLKKREEKRRKKLCKNNCLSGNEDSSYIDYDICPQNSVTAYYCSCPTKNKRFQSDTSGTTTNTTTGTTATTTEFSNTTTNTTVTTNTTGTTNNTTTEEKSSEGSRRQFEHGKSLKRKLSNISIFWNRILRHKEIHGCHGPCKMTVLPCHVDQPMNDVFLEDCSRSNSVPRIAHVPVFQASSDFWKKIRKNKNDKSKCKRLKDKKKEKVPIKSRKKKCGS